MTVFITQEVRGLNFQPARDYGPLKFVLDIQTQILFDSDPVVKQMTKVLEKYTSNDYLLLVGDPVVIGIATALAADVTDGYVKMLKWDRQEKEYYPVELNLYPGTEEKDDREIYGPI